MSRMSRRDCYDISLYRTGTYRSWNNMKNRCSHKSCKGWENYGGRGIAFPQKWGKFSGFLEDMGLRPQGYTLDRIDVNRNYCKENCRWASYSAQNSNRRASSNTGIKHITARSGGYISHVKPFKSAWFKSKESAIKDRDFKLKFRKNNIKFRKDSMLPESITITKRVVIAPYEHEEAQVTVFLEEGDKVEECISKIKKIICVGLGIEPFDDIATNSVNIKTAIKETHSGEAVTEQLPLVPVEKVEEKTEPKKERKKRATVAVSVEEEKTEVSDTVEEEKTEAPVAPEEEKPKKRKIKSAPYDRENSIHKKLFAEHLDRECPGWRKNPNKAVDASKALVGKDFLDEEGSIIKSFKDAVDAELSK